LYGDYVEQLTYLLFIKMADERTRAPYLSPNGGNQKSPVPEQYGWPRLIKKDGDELFDHYRHTLEALGNQKGLLGLIFNKSQNTFQDPAKRRRAVCLRQSILSRALSGGLSSHEPHPELAHEI
jgi:type I restriction enzyme M protein